MPVVSFFCQTSKLIPTINNQISFLIYCNLNYKYFQEMNKLVKNYFRKTFLLLISYSFIALMFPCKQEKIVF